MSVIVSMAIVAVTPVIASTVQANEIYNCVIEGYYDFTESGKVKDAKLAEYMKGGKFKVYKATGVMDGKIGNRGIGTFPKVILPGEGKNPYIAISVDAKKRFVYRLHIANWTDKPQKPFFFNRGYDLFSGLCTLGDAS